MFFSIPIYISRTRDCSNACEPQGPCGGRTPALCDGPCRPPDVFVFLFAVHTRAGEYGLLGTCLSSPVISQQHCCDKCSNCIRPSCGFRGSGLRPSGLWAKLSTHRSISLAPVAPPALPQHTSQVTTECDRETPSFTILPLSGSCGLSHACLWFCAVGKGCGCGQKTTFC